MNLFLSIDDEFLEMGTALKCFVDAGDLWALSWHILEEFATSVTYRTEVPSVLDLAHSPVHKRSD